MNDFGLLVETPRDHPGFLRLDHANIRLSLTADGMISDAIELLHLRRLESICQLQCMTALPVAEQMPLVKGPHTFPHNRLEHSIVVAALMSEILASKLIEAGKKRAACLGGLLHDARMPAGGDMTKLIDLELFDEDRDLSALFQEQKDGWGVLRRRYNLPEETPEIAQVMVEGRGLFGEALDIADTCSYLAFDTRELAASCARMPYGAIPQAYHEILSLAAQGACTLWQEVEIVNDHVIIPGERALLLYRFLLLRILLWRHLYQNPACKVIEQLLMEIVIRELFAQKKISRPLLLQWRDREFVALLEEATGIPDIACNFNLFGEPPRRTSYASWKEALQAEEKLADAGEFTLMYSTRSFQPTKDKTDKYFVRDARGEPVSFAEAHPDMAASINAHVRAMGAAPPAHLVHFPRLPGQKIGKRFEKLWRKARVRWRERTG